MGTFALWVALLCMGSIKFAFGAGMVILPHSSSIISQPNVIFELDPSQSFIPNQDANGEPRVRPVFVYHGSFEANFFNLIWPHYNASWSPIACLTLPCPRPARGVYCFTNGCQNAGAQSTIAKTDIKIHEFVGSNINGKKVDLYCVISDVRPQLSIACSAGFGYSGLGSFGRLSIFFEGRANQAYSPNTNNDSSEGCYSDQPLCVTVSPGVIDSGYRLRDIVLLIGLSLGGGLIFYRFLWWIVRNPCDCHDSSKNGDNNKS